MKPFKVKDRIKSFRYAWQGIKLCISQEHNAWIHSFATLLVLVFGAFFHFSRYEWCIALLCIGLVFAAEIFNTAIEYLVNFISPNYHREAGKIKDLAAGAVLVCAIASFIVGLLLFLPHIIRLF